MEFSFEINTIATVGAEVARKAAKRKRNATVKNAEPIKKQKFNNGAPFIANSPPRCSRERVALNEEASSQPKTSTLPEEAKTSGQEASKHATSAQAGRELLNTVDSQVPSEEQNPNDSSLLRTSSTPETSTLPEEAKTSEQEASKHVTSPQAERELRNSVESQVPSEEQKPNDSSLLRTSSTPETSTLKEEPKTIEQQAPEHCLPSQAKRKRLTTIEDLKPRKQRMLSDGSALRVSSQPKTSTLTEDATISEQHATKQNSPSQAKRTCPSTTEDEFPCKQRKLDDGSALSPSAQSDTFTTKDAESPELQASEHGSPSQAKRTCLSTIEDEFPCKQRKLDDGSALSTSAQPDTSLHSPADVTSSNQATRSSTPAEANPRKGGRPRSDKQFPRQKELRVRTKLRTNRPVKNEIPFEVWQSILEFCPLEFLLKAVNIAYFKDILLRNDSVWKAARLNQFGHDMPDPPPGISEYKYANLLAGSGCHGCDDKLTRRVYWGFVRRWCDNCLKKNVAQQKTCEGDYKSRCGEDNVKGDHFEKIMECVPHVWYDSWHHYQWVGTYEEPPVWAKTYPNGQHRRYSQARMSKMIETVMNSSLTSTSTEEEVETFFEPYIAENNAYMEKLQELEGWWMTRKMFVKSETAALKGDRETNFKEQALSMDPPLQPEALELCPSYQRAKKIASPFTEKVWSVLKAKLINERAAAEYEVAFPLSSAQPRLHAMYY